MDMLSLARAGLTGEWHMHSLCCWQTALCFGPKNQNGEKFLQLVPPPPPSPPKKIFALFTVHIWKQAGSSFWMSWDTTYSINQRPPDILVGGIKRLWKSWALIALWFEDVIALVPFFEFQPVSWAAAQTVTEVSKRWLNRSGFCRLEYFLFSSDLSEDQAAKLHFSCIPEGAVERATAAVVSAAVSLSLNLRVWRCREGAEGGRGGREWQLTVRHPIRLCSKGLWKARGSPHQSSSSVAAVWKFAGFCKCWREEKGKDRESRNFQRSQRNRTEISWDVYL